jgi:hypothetical protein
MGQMKAAPMAYDIVSFLPTQTSSSRLVVLYRRKKARRHLQASGHGELKERLAVWGYSASLIDLTR